MTLRFRVTKTTSGRSPCSPMPGKGSCHGRARTQRIVNSVQKHGGDVSPLSWACTHRVVGAVCRPEMGLSFHHQDRGEEGGGFTRRGTRPPRGHGRLQSTYIVMRPKAAASSPVHWPAPLSSLDYSFFPRALFCALILRARAPPCVSLDEDEAAVSDESPALLPSAGAIT